MANISEEKWIEMLEKKADGSYIAKYPKIKSKSGVTFDEHLAEDVSQGEVHGIPKCKFNATGIPTVNNDISEGYSVGSKWIYNDNLWICFDNTLGAARWLGQTFEDTSLLFYEEGNENSLITGGWVEGYSIGPGFATKKPNHFDMHTDKHSGDRGEKIFVTSRTINLTSIKRLVIDWEKLKTAHMNSRSFISISSNQMGGAAQYNAITAIGDIVFERRYDYLDVSNLNGDYYIKVGVNGGANNSTIETHAKIYGVWGER